LFVHAHYKMFDVDPGFDTKHVIVVSPWSKFRTAPSTPASVESFYHAVSQGVSTVPGVQSTCYSSSVLGEDRESIRITGQTESRREASSVAVSPEYFQTLGIPIVRGRSFLPAEPTHGPNVSVAVVSEKFARVFWPGQDSIGKSFEDSHGK